MRLDTVRKSPKRKPLPAATPERHGLTRSAWLIEHLRQAHLDGQYLSLLKSLSGLGIGLAIATDDY